MKLKSLAVITLLVLGCSAAFAQGSFTLGFTSPGDLFLYCNYEVAQFGGPSNFYFQGIDNLTGACFAATDATIEGVKVSINANDGAPVQGGPAYAYADNLIDAFGQYFTGEQWFVITQTKPSTRLRKYGWVGYLGFSGYEFLDNYGYLSASIPGQSPKKPVSGGNSAVGSKGNGPQTKLTRTIQ